MINYIIIKDVDVVSPDLVKVKRIPDLKTEFHLYMHAMKHCKMDFTLQDIRNTNNQVRIFAFRYIM